MLQLASGARSVMAESMTYEVASLGNFDKARRSTTWLAAASSELNSISADSESRSLTGVSRRLSCSSSLKRVRGDRSRVFV